MPMIRSNLINNFIKLYTSNIIILLVFSLLLFIFVILISQDFDKHYFVYWFLYFIQDFEQLYI